MTARSPSLRPPNKAFYPEAELAVAKVAKAGNHLQILSTVATTSIEDAIAARGAPVWFRLYPTQKWVVTEVLAKRVERAGSLVITRFCETPGDRYGRGQKSEARSLHRRRPPRLRPGNWNLARHPLAFRA